ncbi:type II toxin-antitoxin system mRNA interferase toxin, RelE/StbE family [Endozoicomonas gorgoniicola]|uniref:Type II toxin-antitoxin system mRNA interferase toxin, RelE/StbE family n=1 Tax=Endozoicomonas gorgoniicola TaxID=1234144 RepID=A0ABT3N420_9GAMM|nr:type II toxin-antitoxin system mRNA interferase toxin, RelE/StbE family [Endozoicomonas gorgoniicola]MCW7556359.1 type II toxin-antitoxin system mRNA interferase toxin, RelE/StbE family [Endozoicomonas gorgoniicola]
MVLEKPQSGPSGLRLIKGFHDEALTGDWNGYRSSRLNKQYRVIYTVESQMVQVKVIKVTAHDYKKR